MIPIFLDTFIIPAETKLWDDPYFPEIRSGLQLLSEYTGYDDLVTTALAWVLPDRNSSDQPGRGSAGSLVEIDKEGSISDLGIINGVTTEPLFVISSAFDRRAFSHGGEPDSWAVEHMIACDNVDFENAALEIYRDAIRLSSKATQKDEAKFHLGRGVNGYNASIKEPFPISFLTLWDVVCIRDRETGISEVDYMEYHGPGEIIAPVKLEAKP